MGDGLMDYDEFVARFLAALYLETERHNRQNVRASSILEKYNLTPKANWIGRMADEWEYRYFKEIFKTLGGYEGWTFRISPDGYRKIEADFIDEEEVAQFLAGPNRDMVDELIGEVAPASDRLIRFSDNQNLAAALIDGITEIREKIDGSNLLDAEEKTEVAVSLNASISIFQKSKTFLVGAFRYLVLERIKKAFEKTIEDAIRLVVIGLLTALVPLILAAIL